jgi:hypothetical protein
MRLRSTSLATQLSRLVVEALVKIGLTEKDVLGGAFQHTDLPWQVPPLIVEATLFGAPFSEYVDVPTHINIDGMINMFGDVLLDMRNNPRKVLTVDGYRATSYAAPHIKSNERGLYFSMPDGFPGSVTDYAGITFSLECAHIVRHNARLEDFVNDEDNYYAVLPGGTQIGVRDGLPTVAFDQWDIPVHGMVQELLRSPRGALWEGCDYNVISKTRSVVYERREEIKEFEAVDWALQTLRVIDGDKALLTAVRNIKKTAYERGARFETLKQAIQISTAAAITDRQRIEALKNLLVPDIMKIGQFSRQIYSYYKVPPAVLSAKTLVKITHLVQDLYDQEEMLYAREVPTTKERL